MANLKEVELAFEEGDDLAPSKEEAQILLDQMSCNMNHPYMNPSAPPYARDRAVRLADRLLEIIAGKATSLRGFVDKHKKETQEQVKALSGLSTGSGDVDGKKSRNTAAASQIYKIPVVDPDKGAKQMKAQTEIDAIRKDPKHPYNNSWSPQAERDQAIEHVNKLLAQTL